MSSQGKAPQITPAGARTPDSLRKKRDRAASVKDIRGMLGRTQLELATALGVSVKAVQSYEQGWRDVPVRVMIQLLVLLALYRKHTMDDVPCWEIRKCTPAQRERCASFTMGRGQFCWFVGSTESRPVTSCVTGAILPCMDCPVIQRLLKGKSVVSHATSRRG